MQGMRKKVGVSPLETCVAKLEGKLNVVCVELKEVRQFQVLHEPNILSTQPTELGNQCPREEIIAKMEKVLYHSLATLPTNEFEWVMLNHKP